MSIRQEGLTMHRRSRGVRILITIEAILDPAIVNIRIDFVAPSIPHTRANEFRATCLV
jgi:hypothetical protein